MFKFIYLRKVYLSLSKRWVWDWLIICVSRCKFTERFECHLWRMTSFWTVFVSKFIRMLPILKKTRFHKSCKKLSDAIIRILSVFIHWLNNLLIKQFNSTLLTCAVFSSAHETTIVLLIMHKELIELFSLLCLTALAEMVSNLNWPKKGSKVKIHKTWNRNFSIRWKICSRSQSYLIYENVGTDVREITIVILIFGPFWWF